MADAGQVGLADALAAAQITIELAARTGSTSLNELSMKTRTILGALTTDIWVGCRSLAVTRSIASMPEANPNADPSHIFYGRYVTFTGALSIVRAVAQANVAALGGQPQPGPNRLTDFLIIGDRFAGDSPEQFTSGKATRAAALRAKGSAIQVLTEPEFLAAIADTAAGGTRPVVITRSRSVRFMPPTADSYRDYWSWQSASLRVASPATGGEPCRVCGAAIKAEARRIHRDRQVCSVLCNSGLKRRWARQVANGTLCGYEAPHAVVAEARAETSRAPHLFATVGTANFPYEHGRWPIDGDVIERHGIHTRYVRLSSINAFVAPQFLTDTMANLGLTGDRVLLLICEEYELFGATFIEEDGSPMVFSMGHVFSDEGILAAGRLPTAEPLHFGRELISDVDENGVEFRWDAWIFSPFEPPVLWTPARHALSDRRKAATKERAEASR